MLHPEPEEHEACMDERDDERGRLLVLPLRRERGGYARDARSMVVCAGAERLARVR